MVKAILGALVLVAGALAWNVPAASAQRAQCLSSNSSIDLIVNGDGFDVTATATLAVSTDAVVTAELHKAKQGAPEEHVRF